MTFTYILSLILHYVLPYGIMFALLFFLISFLEQRYRKANEDRFLSILTRWAIGIGIPSIGLWWIIHQPWWQLVVGKWHIFTTFMRTRVPIWIYVDAFNQWVATLLHNWGESYWNAFVVVFFLGFLIELMALKWRISFARACNALIPVVLTYPRIFTYFTGRQTPLQDMIIAGKIKGKLKENLNDSYEAAVAQDGSFVAGASGSSGEATKINVAVAMRKSTASVRTTADGFRTAKLSIRHSRETETDRAIESALKGFGSRVSVDKGISFPADATDNTGEGAFTFSSNDRYDAGEVLGRFSELFANPFADENRTVNGGMGIFKAYFEIPFKVLAWLGRFSPYGMYRRMVLNADEKFKRDTSADKAKYKVQQNLDLSVIPEPKSKDGKTIEEQREIALQKAKQRVPKVTTALNALKINGQFKGVKVGGNTAIYTYSLPPDPNLPTDFNKASEQLSNMLRIKGKPVMTLGAGVLEVSIENGVNIPVSFADMILRRKKGANDIISGMVGVDALGEPVYFELGDKNPHAMFFGKTGTGKTVSIMTILYSVMSATDPEHLRIAYVDGKGNSFQFMASDSSHPNPFTYAPPGDASGDIEYSRAVIRSMENETRRRIDLFKKMEVSKLAVYNKKMEEEGKPILPEILFVVDEFSAITQQDKNLKASEINKYGTIDRFEYIAKMSRSVGIRMLLTNQSARKELVPGKISANVTGRVSLGVSEPIESEIALPETGIAVHLISQPGEFYSIMNGPTNPEHGTGPYLPDDVLNALNDKLIERFGECKYVKTRDDILHEMDEQPEGEASSLGLNAIAPEPLMTTKTPLDEIAQLDEKYYPWLDANRAIVEENETVKLSIMKNSKDNLKKKAILDKLDKWLALQKEAKMADTHKSTGSMVKSVALGNDEPAI